MRQALRLLAHFLGLFLFFAASARGDDASEEPYAMVRSLRALQDQIARGSGAAHLHQRTLIAQIARQLRQTPASAWLEPRNVRAVIVYGLSGGDPGVLRDLLRAGAFKGGDETLLKGALAYGEGRYAEAAEWLNAIEARTLGPVLAGHVALVQAVLKEKRNAREAIALFDEARLLAPGTLVEEAALRREALLLAEAGEWERFEILCSQYFRRFSHSVYAASFRRLFAQGLASAGDGDDAGPLQRLEPALQELTAAERAELYLWTAREAALKGKVALTRFAAERAAPLTETGSDESLRLRLYHAAALVASDAFETGLAMLKTIDRAALDGGDRELFDAASSVGEAVQRLPEESPSGVPPPKQAEEPGKSDPDVGALAAERARQALAQADELLGRGRK